MASKDTEAQRPLPPYLSFKTLEGFIQRLGETAVPERVDGSVLRNYAGSIARKLTAALRFLGLTEDGGRTTEKLARLVKAYGTPEWAMTLSEVITVAYRPVVGDLNLQTATPALVNERFRAWGAEGTALPACVAFYISALKSANVPISPHVVQRARGRPERGRSRSRRAAGTEAAQGLSVAVQDTLAVTDAVGTVRFSFPIPDKPAVTMFLPADLVDKDWAMIDTMVRAYILRKEKAREQG